MLLFIEKYIPKDGVVYIVMENLLLPFKNPNVMDLKFGTRLYDEGVTEAKKERMIYNATSTTSFKTGLKICGVHVNNSLKYIYIYKMKSIMINEKID